MIWLKKMALYVVAGLGIAFAVFKMGQREQKLQHKIQIIEDSSNAKTRIIKAPVSGDVADSLERLRKTGRLRDL